MINKIKAWDSLIDNDHVKRALEVALAGKHTIMVIGHKDNGFNHIKELMDNAVCVEPCPCGFFGEPRHACQCTVSQIGKFRTSKKWRNAWESDISIQLLTPSTTQNKYKTEGFEKVLDRINKIGIKPAQMTSEADNLLETAHLRLSFTLGMIERIRSVAGTIAALDHQAEIHDYHIAEAIQYKTGGGK